MDSEMRQQIVHSAVAVALAGLFGMSLFVAASVSAERITRSSLPAANRYQRTHAERLAPLDRTPLASTPLSEGQASAPHAADEQAGHQAPGRPHGDHDDDTDYKSETKAIVAQNATELAAAVSTAMSIFTTGTATDLLSRIAPDEGAGIGEADAWFSAYPSILDSIDTQTIQVFAFGEQTIYYGFSVVNWTDGGVTSQHTISVPLRLVDGAWYLSTVSLDTPGLKFVQSVQL